MLQLCVADQVDKKNWGVVPTLLALGASPVDTDDAGSYRVLSMHSLPDHCVCCRILGAALGRCSTESADSHTAAGGQGASQHRGDKWIVWWRLKMLAGSDQWHITHHFTSRPCMSIAQFAAGDGAD